MIETVYYDGNCGLCHRLVLLTLRLDRRGRFRLAPLCGETFKARIWSQHISALPDSVIVQTADGRLLTRSRALVYIFQHSGWPWLAWMIRSLPTSWGDKLYDFIARRRRRWFAAPQDVCPVVPEHLRARFLP